MTSSEQKADKTRFLVLCFTGLFFLFVFAVTVYASQLLFSLNHPWTFADWLINYQGGFVRRGFIGEGIYIAYQNLGMSPYHLVMAIQLGLYLVILVASWLVIARQRFILPLLPVIIAPFMFAYSIHDMGGGFRKEILYLATISCFSAASLRCSEKCFNRLFIGLMLFFPVLVLSHEMLIVFLPYLLAIYLLRRPANGAKELLRIALLSIPTVIALVFCYLFQGSETSASIIRESWGNLISSHESSIDWLAYDINHARQLLESFNEDNAYLVKHLILFLLAQLAFIPIYPRLFRLRDSKIPLALCLTSLVGTLVLAFIAIDWGRFLYINAMSLFFVAMVLPEPNPVSDRRGFQFLKPQLDHRKPITFSVTLLLLAIYGFSWHIPACCNASWLFSDISRGAIKVLRGGDPVGDHKFAQPQD